MSETVEQDRKIQVRAVLSFLLIVTIIVVTVLGVIVMMLNKSKAKEEIKEKFAPRVEVVALEKGNHRVVIMTQGVVESQRETNLAAEVGGRVVEVSPNLKRGAKVGKNEVLVRLEASDYRAALASSEVALADAELALEQERAKVEQAKLDWEKLGTGKPINALVLREPYLKAAEARAGAAQEDVARARRDLERTEIQAPFDAGVRMADVEEGAVLAPGGMVAELYASEELEVRLPLSLLDFGFVERDGEGKVLGKVVLKGKIGMEDYEWEAVAVRVDPEIDRKALSAAVVVKVLKAERDEFAYPPVGLFVKAEVDGKDLEDVVEIPRRGLLEGDRVIVVGKEDKITFREVSVLRLKEKTAVVKGGLDPGDRMVLTRLAAATEGMDVVVEDAEPPAEKEEEK